jgi:hypothetical protein
MPGSVRLKLDRAIADHLKAHDARYYDLLRDDPAFAPWIGTHLGARGEKRLDRAIADVRRFQKQKLARKAAPIAHPADEAAADATAVPTGHLMQDPAQRFATAGAAVLSYEELQDRFRQRQRQLDCAIEACLNEAGEPIDPRLFLQLIREERALVAESAELAKRYYADLNSKDVVQGVLKGLAVDPTHARALQRDIDNVFHRATGLAAIKGNGS